MIKTDGVSCSVLLIKAINGKPIKITTGQQRKVKLMKDNIDKYNRWNETKENYNHGSWNVWPVILLIKNYAIWNENNR